MPITQPAVKDVADLLHLRTVTRGNIYLGDFSDETATRTNPTSTRATELIGKAHDYVHGKLGDPETWDVTEEERSIHHRDATRMIEIYAAMLIELSHYPDQIRGGSSPYPELKVLFDAGMASLIEAMGGDGSALIDDDSEAPGATGGTAMGSWDFPETSIGDGVMP